MNLTDGDWEYNPVLRTISAGDTVLADLHFSDAAHDEMDDNGRIMAASKRLHEVCVAPMSYESHTAFFSHNFPSQLEKIADVLDNSKNMSGVVTLLREKAQEIREALVSLSPQSVA